MIRAFLLLVWLVLGLPALAAETRLIARESLRVEFAGAQAAFALDASIVEVSMAGADVVLFGRRTGRTLVTVVLPGAMETLAVHVEAGAASLTDPTAFARERVGSAELRYDSGQHRFSTSIHARVEGQSHTTRLRLEGLHERGHDGRGGLTALPHASIEIDTPTRKVTLLDERVEGTPLGLDGVVVRGAHLRQGAWEVHAGLASATPYEDLLVPRDGDPVLSVAGRVRADHLDFLPSFVYLPDSVGEWRAVASLGLQGEAGPLSYKLEAGWGGRFGAAADVRWVQPRRQAWVNAVLKPNGFAAPGMGRLPGSRVDAAWTEQLGERTTVTASAASNRLDLAGVMPESTSARIDVRQQVGPGLATTSTVSTAEYRSLGSAARRRSTVSLAMSYDRSEFGASAQYRHQDLSASGTGGHGGRLALRAMHGGLRANAFIDAQQHALTLGLLLRERTDLARALAELGIEASDPETLLRQFRDNAALLAPLGVAIGEVRLNPLRLQAGLDATWRGVPGGPELTLRVLADQVESAGRERRSYVASLGGSWRVRRDLALGLAYSRWSAQGHGIDNAAQSAFQLWVRFHFSDLSLPGMGSAAITGRVVREDATEPGLSRALSGVTVVMDGGRRTRTDDDGRYAFERPGPGAHRVEAELPDAPGAYFLTPSSRMAKPGDEVSFGITFSGGRLSGTVRDDVDTPLAGVTVRLEGASPRSAVTDGAGHYRITAPAGEARVSIAAESLPAGFDVRGLEPTVVRLAAGAPSVSDLKVRAQRAVKGVVPEGAATVLARAPGFEREIRTDAAGKFMVRGLPAGALTLVIRSTRGERQVVLQVPAAPGVTDTAIPQ